MADIGAVGRYAFLVPLPRRNVGGRIEDWISGVVEATRTRLQARTRHREPKKEYHHPRREVFLEDAAMSREMFRL